jgi:hypothetical protein
MIRGTVGNMRFAVLAVLLAASLFTPRIVSAQGESAVPFLLIAPNARADGMGEAGAALSDDGSAVYWNPGGLAFEKNQEVSITHSNWLPQFQLSDLFYEYFSYRNHVEDWGGTVSGSIIYLSLGEFQRTDEQGNNLGTFKAYEFAITGGFSTKLSSDLGMGLNIRYIHSSLDPDPNSQFQDRKGVASSVSADIGFLWKPTKLPYIEDRLNVGLNLSNLGPKMAYIQVEQADPLPTNLRLGLAYKVIKSQYNNITAVVDFNRLLVRRYPAVLGYDSVAQKPILIQDVASDNLPKSLFSSWGDGGLRKVTIGGGLEYWYGAPKLFALRWGYFYEDPSYGGRKFMTFGAGIRYDVYGFDFSYLSAIEENHPLSETLRFTLMIGWGNETSKD